MTVESAIDALRQDPQFLRHVTTWQRLPARVARTVSFPADLDPRLVATLQRRGIEALYLHQAAAWHEARAGRHLVVVTPTASGKTLCYNLPVAQRLLQDPNARALYLFPTKALAQDQLAELQKLEFGSSKFAIPNSNSLSPATYDGDTPRRDRARIRQQARIVLTNPDMLHAGILPHHLRWAGLLRGLRYVVIDELHAYRGVFGSHVANVLRRLRRICRFYGSDPQFLCASATIANPQELAQQLVGGPVALVDEDGSPKGERHLLFYNPPLLDAELGLRRSSTLEAEAIAARLVANGVQTIVFARSRLTVEVLLTYLRDRTSRFEIRDSKFQIRGYRGGYLPSERRAIEQGLRDGSVRAVVATNALELGVDIGGLDAAVLTGFPGTIASTWQQAGRAGRQGRVSLAILVATPGALDQYIITHPAYFLERNPEHALINPDNLVILNSHLACAAFELPFHQGEAFGAPHLTEAVLDYLTESGDLQQHDGDWFWMGEADPAQAISLRTASPDNIVIHTRATEAAAGLLPGQSTAIGQLERQAAPLLLYEGAIYLHEGQSYLVEQLDWDNGQAWVVPVEADYYTQASIGQQVCIMGIDGQDAAAGVHRAHGPVQVISQATAFRKIKLHSHETLGYGEIDLPEQVLETDAFWLAFGEELLDGLRVAGLWRSDPNDYGPNWQQQRQAARARDGYRCTLCSTPEGGGRQHDVHHRIPFRSFGYVPGLNQVYHQANQLDNLVTLCRSCHRRVERGQRLRTGLGGLAYVLGNVAPLHLMCDPQDIGVVSEMATANGGSPVRLEAGAEDPAPAWSAGAMPTITIYEKVPAGIGFSQRLFEIHSALLQAAGEVVSGCPCQKGCPACVGPLPADGEGDIDPKALTLALVDACLTKVQDGSR